jgi:hypothetical protein
MGIRINNSIKKIDKVFINGEEHFAFNNELVILPNLPGTTADIKILLTDNENIEPHLTYISNRLQVIEKTERELLLTTLTKSKSKFSFRAPEGYLLINADGFNYSLSNSNEINGYVNSDRNIRLKKIESNEFSVLKSTVRISDYSEKENEMVFKVMSSVSSDTTQIQFKSTKDINKVLLDNLETNLKKEGNKYSIQIDPFEGEKEIMIQLN